MVTAVIGLSIVLPLAATTFAAQPQTQGHKERQASAAPAPAPTAAASIEVTVIQVAGTQAFLKPGATGGVHRRAKVVINRKEYQVIQTSDSFAVIEVGNEPLHEQDKGQATVVGVEGEKAKELDKPEPLSKWKHAWTKEEAPANAQRPRFVPLGGNTERDRLAARAAFQLSHGQPVRGPRAHALRGDYARPPGRRAREHAAGPRVLRWRLRRSLAKPAER